MAPCVFLCKCINEKWSYCSFLVQWVTRVISSLLFTLNKSNKKILQAAGALKRLIFFHDILSFTGSGRAPSVRARFASWKLLVSSDVLSDKKTSILSPTVALNWDYLGNTSRRVNTIRNAGPSDCTGACFHHLSVKPATHVITPVKLGLRLTEGAHGITSCGERSSAVRRLSGVKSVSMIHSFSSFTGVYSMTHSGLDL